MGVKGVESGEEPERQRHNLQLRDGMNKTLEKMSREASLQHDLPPKSVKSLENCENEILEGPVRGAAPSALLCRS